MSLKILTLTLLIFYSLYGADCHYFDNAECLKNSDFTKTLLQLADLFETKTDISYSKAEELLNTELVELKQQCLMNKNLFNVDRKLQDYKKTCQKIMKKECKSLTKDDAKELWNSVETFFSEFTNCYPDNFLFRTTPIHKISFNMMSIIIKETISKRYLYLRNKELLETTNYDECQLNKQNQRKILFFQELQMQMSPIIGDCNVSFVKRKCVFNKLKDKLQDSVSDLRRVMSPIGPENICKDV